MGMGQIILLVKSVHVETVSSHVPDTAKAWGLHTGNMFTSKTSAQLPQYNSLFHNTTSEVGALAQEDRGIELLHQCTVLAPT